MHHNPPLLRTATHNDMHAIWQIDAKVFGEDVYPAFFFRQAMDLWPELLLVAEYEGQLVGYVLGGFGQERSQGWVLSLAVLPEARGFGLAERMMRQMEANQQALQISETAAHGRSGQSGPAPLLPARLHIAGGSSRLFRPRRRPSAAG